MKVRDTSPGRLYALSSEIGCTAINGAMAVDIPVGGQVVVLALDKKIIIDGDDAAKFVEVRWGTNTAVGSRPVPSWLSDVLAGLVYIVGDDNFDINYIPAENKLYLQFALDTTDAQIKEIKSWCARVLPNDLAVEMEWADGLPIDYTHLEYLEQPNIQSWINTGLLFATGVIKARTSTPVDPDPTDSDRYTSVSHVVTGLEHTPPYAGVALLKNFKFYQETSDTLTAHINGISASNRYYFRNIVPNVATIIVDIENGYAEVNGLRRSFPAFVLEEVVTELPIFAVMVWYAPTDLRIGRCRKHTRVHSFEVTAKANGEVQHGNFIPALDNTTGQPGMYDTINRVFKTNVGTGDYLYPGKETEVDTATTYSIRSRMSNRMYGKITEHGIRRLYRVPEGYSSKEEYAAENGFKLIVEPPIPEEGSWAPVWHDREDCIELEWVETAPPTEVEHPTEEEETSIEDTENA